MRVKMVGIPAIVRNADPAVRGQAGTIARVETAVVQPKPAGGLWTAPNLITVVRLCCLPLFLYLLFGRDNRVAAGLLLGGLGATDWVDGWVARRFNQVSEFGKMFDPTADRLLFIVGVAGIIIDRAAPLWFCWLVVGRNPREPLIVTKPDKIAPKRRET